jgi:hypothetical protein
MSWIHGLWMHPNNKVMPHMFSTPCRSMTWGLAKVSKHNVITLIWLLKLFLLVLHTSTTLSFFDLAPKTLSTSVTHKYNSLLPLYHGQRNARTSHFPILKVDHSFPPKGKWLTRFWYIHVSCKKLIKFNPSVSREVHDQHIQCSLVMGINNILTIYLKDINE